MSEFETIGLEPVESLTITTLVDNVTDILLLDEGVDNVTDILLLDEGPRSGRRSTPVRRACPRP